MATRTAKAEFNSFASLIGLGVSVLIALGIFLYGWQGTLGAREFAVQISRATNRTELVGELVRSKFIWDFDRLNHAYKIIPQGINRAAFVDHSTGSEQTDINVDQRIEITSSDKVKFEFATLVDYKIDPEKAISLIANYPVEDAQKFETQYLLNWVRQALSEVSVDYDSEAIYKDKENFRVAAEEKLRGILEPLGITLVSVVFKSDPIPADPNIVESYQRIIKTQLAEKEAEEQVKVQAQQNILISNQAKALKEGAESLNGIKPELLEALNNRYDMETRRLLEEKGINGFPAFMVPSTSLK
jgi:SPFH domain / Band 7 family